MNARKIIISTSIVVVVIAAGLLLGPKPISTSTAFTGDLDLAQRLNDNAPKGSRNVSAFTVNGDDLTFAGLSTDEHSEFEIGSITKTFTAELLRNAIDRKELTLDTTVGDILGTDSDITLEELATHTSGLPRLDDFKFSDFTWQFFGSNPYGSKSIKTLFDATSTTQLSNRGQYEYSNFGFALLGQLIAHNAGTSYEKLLEERILRPLNMQETYVMLPGSVPDSAPRGVLTNGRTSAPWEMEADAPAGAIRSTAHDMSLYTQYLLKVGVPDFTWAKETDLYWHNGATGGFSAFLALDPVSSTAAFVVNDSAASVDHLGVNLIRGNAQ